MNAKISFRSASSLIFSIAIVGFSVANITVKNIPTARADIIPPDQKSITVCSYIHGMENFPKLTFLIEEKTPSGASTLKTVNKDDCIAVSYKFNTIKLYAVNTDYYLAHKEQYTAVQMAYLPENDKYAYPSDIEIQTNPKFVPLSDKTEYEHYDYRVDGIDNTAKLLKISFMSMQTNLMVSDGFPKKVEGLDSEILIPQVGEGGDGSGGNKPIGEFQTPFSDIIWDNPYRPALDYLKDQKIVHGYLDGTYRPDNHINRAEFVQIVAGALKDDDNVQTCLMRRVTAGGTVTIFRDIQGQPWFLDAVCYAKEKGIITGYDDGTFRADKDISFSEAAKVLVNAFHLKVDSATSIWYEKYVRALEAVGAIPDSVKRFQQPLTRGEMANMIFRIKEMGAVSGLSQKFSDLK